MELPMQAINDFVTVTSWLKIVSILALSPWRGLVISEFNQCMLIENCMNWYDIRHHHPAI